MVTPQRQVGWLTLISPSSTDRKEKKKVVVSPESRAPGASAMDVNGGSPVNENEMWKRLREVGLDEETLQKKDKAALISHITKLESEAVKTTLITRNPSAYVCHLFLFIYFGKIFRVLHSLSPTLFE